MRRIHLTTRRARLSLLDEYIGTSTRFHAYITEKSHAKMLYIFLTGCVRTLRHLYGYATGGYTTGQCIKTQLGIALLSIFCS